MTAKADIDKLYESWRRQPDSSHTTAVVQALDPVISKALHGYGFGGDSLARTTAQLHLAKALPRFDPSRGKLSSFAVTELQRLQRVLPRQQYALPVPEAAAFDLRDLKLAETELSAELGRDATMAELSDKTGLSRLRITRLRQRFGRPEVSESAFVSEAGYTDLPGVNSRSEAAWVDAVYDEVDPVDKKIMEWSMGRGGQPVLSKTEIARRLNISPAAVTQRGIRLANKLEEGMAYDFL